LQTATNPRRSHAATNHQTTGNRPARLQAAACSLFRQLPIPGCVSPAIFSPTAFDSSDDFFSVAVATFHRARFDSHTNFFAVRRASGGRDGCRQAGVGVALTEREGQHSNAHDSAVAAPDTRRSYIR